MSEAVNSVHHGTFVDNVLNGHANIEDIDDYIHAWHTAPDDSPAAAMELHDFLGLGWDDYRLWVERPESIRFAFAARRAKMPTAAYVKAASVTGAAARSSDDEAASRVLDWLKKTGRVSDVDLH